MVARAELGEEARRFVDSDLGRLVLGMAKQEVELAAERLIGVDPADVVSIRAIQLDMACGLKFEQWLFKTIQDGEESLAAFKQQQQE